jgi:N-acetylmuramoyl-L-alanine amidase
VLVELGYLSHPQEGETLARKDRRTQIVQDLRQAILRFSDQRAR